MLKYQLNDDHHDNYDIACIEIGDLKVTLARKITIPVPHEFSVFVPRVEIRKRCYSNGSIKCETETIYNSLTIVHSPQRPPTESLQGANKEKNKTS
ncbi:MAG: hypothetical protein JL56_09885 [Desulfotomaculum sp. BICA1-6]|nr:MAG: hypothetical protein JL56_09885 [Desulfotomaculum sp. BICA1-6]